MLAQIEKYILKHSQNKQEIRMILGASLEKLSVADGIEVLRLLLGRDNFDYEMVGVLKQRGCDLNKPLGDVYANPDGYTTTDYLASYGRLSPRLISEMAKAGYDFKRLNNRGEHAGFYLVGGAPLNKEVVAALKAQGVDFSIKNKDGKTVAETAVEGLITYAKTVGSHPRVMFKNRLGAFFERRDDFVDLYYADKDKIVEDLNRWFAEIEPEINADKGIQSVYKEIMRFFIGSSPFFWVGFMIPRFRQSAQKKFSFSVFLSSGNPSSGVLHLRQNRCFDTVPHLAGWNFALERGDLHGF